MQEATVVQWLKRDGEMVAEGEPSVEIEGAKVNETIQAPASGRARVGVLEGATVPIRELLGEIETA